MMIITGAMCHGQYIKTYHCITHTWGFLTQPYNDVLHVSSCKSKKKVIHYWNSKTAWKPVMELWHGPTTKYIMESAKHPHN